MDADGHNPLHVAAYMAHLKATRLLAKRYMSDSGTQPRQPPSSQNVTSVVTKRRHVLSNADSNGRNVIDSDDGSGGLSPNKRRRVSTTVVGSDAMTANASGGDGGDGNGDGGGDGDGDGGGDVGEDERGDECEDE